MVIDYAIYVWNSINIPDNEIRPGDLIYIIKDNPNKLTIDGLEAYVTLLNSRDYKWKKGNILLYKEWIVYNRDSKINKVLE